MLKKYWLKAFCTFCLLTLLPLVAEAGSVVQKFTQSVHRDNVRRFVLEVDKSTGYELDLDEENNMLTLRVNGKLKAPSIARKIVTDSDYIQSYSLLQDEDSTLLQIRLKKQLPRRSYKAFKLKKDDLMRRPHRVVLDMRNAVKGKVYTKPTTTKKGEIVPRRLKARYKVVGGIAGKRITLDAGHGGTDPGAIGRRTGVQEKVINFAVTNYLKKALLKRGAIVSLTRTTDRDVWGPDATDRQELQARVDVAEKNDADLFISLHCNSSTSSEAGGFSTYYNAKTPYDVLVAKNIQNRLKGVASVTDLGIRTANFYVNKWCSMPGALVEMLFLSNRREEKLLQSAWFQRKMAEAIAKGIEDFYKQVGREAVRRKGK